MPQARAVFPVTPKSATDARRFVRSTLAGWDAGSLEDAATAVVSELATNALLHARTPFAVELSMDGRALRLCVSDGSPQVPVRKSHSAEATTGRGLELISAWSVRWGIDRHSQGKTVWCQIASSQGVEAGPSPAAGIQRPTGRPGHSGGHSGRASGSSDGSRVSGSGGSRVSGSGGSRVSGSDGSRVSGSDGSRVSGSGGPARRSAQGGRRAAGPRVLIHETRGEGPNCTVRARSVEQKAVRGPERANSGGLGVARPRAQLGTQFGPASGTQPVDRLGAQPATLLGQSSWPHGGRLAA